MESQTEDGNGEEGFPEGGQQNKGVGGAQLHNQVNWVQLHNWLWDGGSCPTRGPGRVTP